MPSTIEDLQAAIQDCKSEANSIMCLNRNVLEEYEHRQQQVVFDFGHLLLSRFGGM